MRSGRTESGLIVVGTSHFQYGIQKHNDAAKGTLMRFQSTIFLLLVLCSACARPPEAQHDQVSFLDNNHHVLATVAVEIADTHAKQTRGLMGRRLPDDDRHGMLFVFENAAPRVFWMHNTPGPLDMIFVDENGRVLNIVENAAPYSRQHHASHGPARYVVEVPGGFAARHRILPGTRMGF